MVPAFCELKSCWCDLISVHLHVLNINYFILGVFNSFFFFCSPEDRPAGMSASELISSACFRLVVAMKNPFLAVEMTGWYILVLNINCWVTVL